MISKFNFYDIYGYLLPGLVLLTFLWLPYGLATGQWPGGGQLVTTLLAIPLAYVTGHLLRSLEVFPSTLKDSNRYPSDVLLDMEDPKFSADFKKELAARIFERFHIDVNAQPDASTKLREDAFFLCRSVLIEGKTVSYGEQFEGMYALMRGLAVAFLLASAHYAGWALAFWKYECLRVAFDIVLVGGLMTAILASRQLPKSAIYSISAALVSWGYLLAYSQPASQSLWGCFFAMMLAAILITLRSYRAFKYFAWEFPKAIYRDFYSYQSKRTESKDAEK